MMKKVASEYGVDLYAVKTSLNTLKKGDVVLLNINGKTHYVTIQSIDKNYVIFNDPVLGPIKIPRKDFDKWYTGYTLSTENKGTPVSEDEQNNLWGGLLGIILGGLALYAGYKLGKKYGATVKKVAVKTVTTGKKIIKKVVKKTVIIYNYAKNLIVKTYTNVKNGLNIIVNYFNKNNVKKVTNTSPRLRPVFNKATVDLWDFFGRLVADILGGYLLTLSVYGIPETAGWSGLGIPPALYLIYIGNDLDKDPYDPLNWLGFFITVIISLSPMAGLLGQVKITFKMIKNVSKSFKVAMLIYSTTRSLIYKSVNWILKEIRDRK